MSGSYLIRQMGLLMAPGRILAPARVGVTQIAFKTTESAGTKDSKSSPPPVDEFANDSAEKIEAGQLDSDLMATIPEAEEARERDEAFDRKVEQMRNVSRFHKAKLVRMHNREMPVFTDPENAFLRSTNLYRKIYAKHGRESGINPGLSWPTARELENQIRFESEKGLTLEKKIGILVERKMSEIEAEQKVVKDSEAALKKMPKQVEEFYQRIARRYKIEEEKKAKQLEILDLARDHYGYDVDPRDQKVQDFIKKVQTEKKQEQKKLDAKNKQQKQQQQASKTKAEADAKQAASKKEDNAD